MGRRRNKSNSQSKHAESECDAECQEVAEKPAAVASDCQHAANAVCESSKLVDLDMEYIDTCSQCAIQAAKRLERNAKRQPSTSSKVETSETNAETAVSLNVDSSEPLATSEEKPEDNDKVVTSNPEVLLCVTCLQRSCTKNRHALQHYNNSRKDHPLVIDPHTFDLFCFACDCYVQLSADDIRTQQFVNGLADRMQETQRCAESKTKTQTTEKNLESRETGHFDVLNNAEKPVVTDSGAEKIEDESKVKFESFDIDQTKPTRPKPSAPSNRKSLKSNANVSLNEGTNSKSITQLKAKAKEKNTNESMDEESTVLISGLANLGNTCFFNSTLQSLVRVPCLRELLSSLLETDLVKAVADCKAEANATIESKKIASPSTVFIGGRYEPFEGDFANAEELEAVVQALCCPSVSNEASKRIVELPPVAVHFGLTYDDDDSVNERVTKLRSKTRAEIGEQLVNALAALDAEPTHAVPGFATKRKSTYNPSGLFTKIADRVPRFRTYQQQDAHELLCYLLDALRTEFISQLRAFLLLRLDVDSLLGRTSEPADLPVAPKNKRAQLREKQEAEAAVDRSMLRKYGALMRYASPVDALFGGTSVTFVRCRSCCLPFRPRFEHFLNVSLPITRFDDHEKPKRVENARKPNLPRREAEKISDAAPSDSGNSAPNPPKTKPSSSEQKLSKHQLKKQELSARAAKRERKREAQKALNKAKIADQLSLETSQSPSESVDTTDALTTTDSTPDNDAAVAAVPPQSEDQLEPVDNNPSETSQKSKLSQADQLRDTGETVLPQSSDCLQTCQQSEAVPQEDQVVEDCIPQVQDHPELPEKISNQAETAHGASTDESSSTASEAQPSEMTEKEQGCKTQRSSQSSEATCTEMESAGSDAKNAIREGEADGEAESDECTSNGASERAVDAVRGCSQVDSAVGSSESLDDRSVPQCSSSSSYTHVEELDERAALSVRSSCEQETPNASGPTETSKRSKDDICAVYRAVFAASRRCTSAKVTSDRRSTVVNSLEEAFEQFVRPETMFGSNQVECPHCTRSQSLAASCGVPSDSASSDADVDPPRSSKKPSAKPKTTARGVKSDADLQTLLYELPAVLVVHFKRFAQQGTSLRKINDHVQFGLSLDLAPFCSCFTPFTISTATGNSQRSGRSKHDGGAKNSGKAAYRLFAVVQHEGSMRSGHYISYVRARRSASLRNAMEKLRDRMQRELSGLGASSLDGLVSTYLEHFAQTEEQNSYNETETETETEQENEAENQTVVVKESETVTTNEKSASEEWFYCSDSHVRRCSVTEVLRAEAYLLFYESSSLFAVV